MEKKKGIGICISFTAAKKLEQLSEMEGISISEYVEKLVENTGVAEGLKKDLNDAEHTMRRMYHTNGIFCDNEIEKYCKRKQERAAELQIAN